MSQKIVLTTIAIIIPLLTVMAISLLISPEIAQKQTTTTEPSDERCATLLKEIADNNQPELINLYDDITIRKTDRDTLTLECETRPQEEVRTCMTEMLIYQEKLDCMQAFLAGSNITKAELGEMTDFHTINQNSGLLEPNEPTQPELNRLRETKQIN